MGSKQSVLLKRFQKLRQQFTLIYQAQDGQVKEYQNRITKDIVQFSLIHQLQQITNNAYQSYQTRKLYSFIYTPALYNYQLAQSSKSAGNQKKKRQHIQVLVQQTYQRLANFKIKTKQDRQFIANSLMRQVLEGCQYLYHQYGPFRITKSKIGWTNRKICKVWINQNFALNSLNQKGSSQSSMLREIFRIFQSILGVSFNSQKLLNFQEALKFYEKLNFAQLQKIEQGLETTRQSRTRHKTSYIQSKQVQRQIDALMDSQPNTFGHQKKQFRTDYCRNSAQSINNNYSSFKSMKSQRNIKKKNSIIIVQGKSHRRNLQRLNGYGCLDKNNEYLQNSQLIQRHNHNQKSGNKKYQNSMGYKTENEEPLKIPVFCNKTNRILINPKGSYDISYYRNQQGSLTDRLNCQQQKSRINDQMKKKKSKPGKIYEAQSFDSSEHWGITTNQSEGSQFSDKTAQKVEKQNHNSQAKNNNCEFVLNKNKFMEIPYQTSSLKIGSLKPLLLSQSFGGNNSTNLDFLNKKDQIKGDQNDSDSNFSKKSVKKTDCHQRKINQICGGQAKVITFQETLNKKETTNIKCQKYLRYEDEINLIQENELQQQLDGLFLGDQVNDQDFSQQKQYFDQIRVQLAQLLNQSL